MKISNDLKIHIKDYVWVTTDLKDIKITYCGHIITFREDGAIEIKHDGQSDIHKS